jgi:hypothetical protein
LGKSYDINGKKNHDNGDGTCSKKHVQRRESERNFLLKCSIIHQHQTVFDLQFPDVPFPAVFLFMQHGNLQLRDTCHSKRLPGLKSANLQQSARTPISFDRPISWQQKTVSNTLKGTDSKK